MSKNDLSLLAVSVILGFAPSTYAESTVLSEHITTVISAKPIQRVPPRYPYLPAMKGQEGWAKVSFVIDKEGNVLDPIIQDSSGLKDFDKSALRAVSEWKYSPATQDGQPIEQCQTLVQMDFRLNSKIGVTRSFRRDYKKIIEAITHDKLDEAAVILTALGEAQMWNHLESAYFWMADAEYAKAIKDNQRELKSVNRALSAKGDGIKTTLVRYLLERQFLLTLTGGEYYNALQSFARLQQIEGSEDTIIRLQPYAEKASQLVKGSEPLFLSATIHQKGNFYHDLARNSFSLAVNQGQLDEVEIRCANKRARFTAAEQSQWHIPENWGACTIFITGTPNTVFDVIESGTYVGNI